MILSDGEVDILSGSLAPLVLLLLGERIFCVVSGVLCGVEDLLVEYCCCCIRGELLLLPEPLLLVLVLLTLVLVMLLLLLSSSTGKNDVDVTPPRLLLCDKNEVTLLVSATFDVCPPRLLLE